MSILKKKKDKSSFTGGGLVLFAEVQEAMKAERVLKGAAYPVRLVAPPPELRKGCDLAVEINIVEQPGIERKLRAEDVAYMEIRPLKGGEEGVLEVVRVTDFGDWVMVKAANMKLTYEKSTGLIVNTSGGGCPDIPLLHAEMLDRTVEDAPRPAEIGYTLCALMLDRALLEARSQRNGGEAP